MNLTQVLIALLGLAAFFILALIVALVFPVCGFVLVLERWWKDAR